MPKRKHRGGPSDRSSPRPNRADTPSPSRYHAGDAPAGKSWAKPQPKSGPKFGAKAGPKAGSKFGLKTGSAAGDGRGRPQTRSDKPDRDKGGWAGKPARGTGYRDQSGARSDQPRDHRRPQGPGKGSFRTPQPAAAPEETFREERPARPSHGRNQFWPCGPHAVKAAWPNPPRRRPRLRLTDEAAQALQSELNDINDLTPEIEGREAIARIVPPGAVHQGAALLSEPLADVALEDIIDRAAAVENSVILILDQVTDPQNVGAILRSAAAFGADAVVVPDRHAPPETGALVKAASGAVEIVPLVRVVNLARAMEDLKAAGFWCAGLDGYAPQTLAAADMTGKVALVLGAEGEGLRRLTRDHCDILVRLPISERMESLNVSAAAAVALYELARKA